MDTERASRGEERRGQLSCAKRVKGRKRGVKASYLLRMRKNPGYSALAFSASGDL